MSDFFILSSDGNNDMFLFSLIKKREEQKNLKTYDQEDGDDFLLVMSGSGIFIGRHGYSGMGDFYSNTHGNTGMGFF